jgi:hypothetical protein
MKLGVFTALLNFDDDYEVQEEVMTWFIVQAADLYDWGIHKLVPRQPLGTVRPIYRKGTPLPSKHPILYIFSTKVRTEFFKHAAHTQFFLFKMPFIS